MKTKEPSNTSVRLTPEGKSMLRELARQLGISMSAVLELAIRQLAAQSLVNGTAAMPQVYDSSYYASHRP